MISFPAIFRIAGYKTIVRLNNSYNKPNLFMIHPGLGGPEAYMSLANSLKNVFHCIGIENYNLYHDNKIDNLHQLAQYYLEHIDKLMLETKQMEYHLLGWSLGGQISLEIAHILEKRGHKNIKVYLLDTTLVDDYLFSSRESLNETLQYEYKNSILFKEIDKLYVKKILLNLEATDRLIPQKISSNLIETKILLFKAMLQDTTFVTEISRENFEYISALEYNNIDKILVDKVNIKLVRIEDCDHANILNKEELLTSEIINYAGSIH